MDFHKPHQWVGRKSTNPSCVQRYWLTFASFHSSSGWVCVAKYNPEGKAAADALLDKSKSKGFFGKGRILDYAGAEADLEPLALPTAEIKTIESRQFFGGGGFSGACKPNILIFAKGTTEIGEMGITVGPSIRAAVTAKGGGQWTVVGVNYSANSDGNYCVGLPGGMVAKGVLESAAQKCPNSQIFLSGYSQGAMVVRNAVAYSNEQARGQVKVSHFQVRNVGSLSCTNSSCKGSCHLWRSIQWRSNQRMDWANQDLLPFYRCCVHWSVQDWCCSLGIL